MLFPQNGNKTALYLRLSRDEDVSRESNSITNQRRILTEYAAEHGFSVVAEYVDDGVSGANFHRPGFEKMLEDAKAKQFQVIIVKDLSRLGRDHIGTGEHIERIFPSLGIRFIAMAEGYDSMFDEEPSADMVPIINFFNEFHAKQTSRKTKASKNAMAKAGKFIGSKAPFGYLLDPEDKHHLIIDEEAAGTVRQIFRYACDGLGYKAIARRLRDAGILNPTAYNNIKFPTFHKSEYWRKPHDWHESSIKTILHNPTYLGKVVSGRRRVESFKTKKILTMPEDSWTVIGNTHEPLIDQAIWDKAHEKLAVRKRCDNQGAQQIFAGLAKCNDCGYALNYTYNKGNPRYQCSLYSTKGKGYCKSHFITYDDLYTAVLHDIQRRAKSAAHMDKHLLARLEREAAGLLDKQAVSVERDCKRMETRVDELDAIIGKLYEDSVLGHISSERAGRMMTQFEAEQQELKNKLEETQRALIAYQKRHCEMAAFLEVIAGYQELTELNATILNELISQIRVGVKETVDGEKRQKIKIIYKHSCYVDYFEDGDLAICKDVMAKFQALEAEIEKQLPKAI